MTARPRSVATLLAGVTACAVLIASCAAPTEQATPPTSSSVVVYDLVSGGLAHDLP